jgi:tripartite-type tricarboxylate transporter receptor subunit TctC
MRSRNRAHQIVGAAVVAGVLILDGCFGPAVRAEDANFYAGKTITVIVGFGPGTGYDLYARLFARHLPKHLAGHPTVVTQNMPGAGGFTAAGYLFNLAAKDGTVIGMIDQASPLSQVLGTPGLRADVSKFNWIGRFTSNAAVLFARASAGIDDASQMWKRELIISATGQNSRIVSSVLKNLLGLKLRILTGYQSSADSQLALERGEVEAMTLPWTVLKGERPNWLKERFVNLLLQMGTESHPDLKQVPLVTSLARTEEELKVLTLVSNDSRVGRSILAPPGLTPERVADLRRAFAETLSDPALLEEASRAGIDLIPMNGADLQTMIATSVQVSADTVAHVKTLIDTAK